MLIVIIMQKQKRTTVHFCFVRKVRYQFECEYIFMFLKKPWLLIALTIFLFSCLYVLSDEGHVKMETKTELVLPRVSVLSVMPDNHRGKLTFFAEVKPRWQVVLQAHVMGEIKEVHTLAGERVKKGQLLVLIEDSAYQTQLAEAEQAFAEAQLQLTEEKIRLNVKHKKLSHQDVANMPRLNAAHKALDTAKARLVEAKNRLAYTQVRAPFAGVITRREVSLGQTVNGGEALFELINAEKQDLAIHLTQAQWQMLPNHWQTNSALISSALGEQLGAANIKHGGGFADPITRQYSIYLEVDSASLTKPVVPGEFVTVSIDGKQVDNTLLLPESALTRSGHVWFVDKSNRLVKTQPKVLFHSEGQVIITSQSIEGDKQSFQVVTMPMASYLAGMHVSPVQMIVSQKDETDA